MLDVYDALANPESWVPYSPISRAVPNRDLDRRGHAGRKDDAWWHLVDMNTNRDMLGRTHQREDRLMLATPWVAGCAFAIVDG
jgi:hypothetical protein